MTGLSVMPLHHITPGHGRTDRSREVLHALYATDIEYLYDVTRQGNLLHIVGYSFAEQNRDWTITRIFSGSLARMQAQYGLKYL